ncbi:putative leucine-rich repeat-containing protein DDB_G0290503 isoform X1 [Linepithema humile]|uniref:putative leucine-rich repeat-containing protein DDB_G0290503 isoform X1 n=1 Tax=Linepithema humile TaxID=83485 RepID=UPI00351F11FB
MLSPTPSIDRPRLHPGTGYLIAPRVPRGLAAVVEGLTREVLRHRPEDIYVFAAHHFEKLLKLREQYHTEEYSGREYNHEFSTREFNLWPTKETKEIRKSPNSSWSLEKEVEIIENRKKVSNNAAESRENVSTDRENRKASKQTCSKDPSTTKRISKKLKENETTSEARATRIISHMSALHGPGKNIQTKDIKQELRKNKISGDKAKATNGAEKGVRGERRSKTRVSKSDKSAEEEADRATTSTTTTSSSRTSARRPLKKVRRIETESETETEREVAAKLENNRSSVKSNSASCETIARTGSGERRSEARLSAHSFERKVSSRALSMDRIRAYVLRKFASTASLEVLRSPTYVEQVQEVIDRAAPIIKEKLEEIRRPRGKRSRSVDLAWNDESFRQDVRDGRKRSVNEEEAGARKKSGNESESDAKKEENERSVGKDEVILNAEGEKKKARKSSGSGKRSRRRKNNSHGDFEVVDQVDSSSKHSDKSEQESDATRDTLEARLTATQNILEDISKSTCELGGARKIDSAASEPAESEVSDHVNISLPVVRPPSSRNSKSATKNGSDNLTLPPISPEAPKSTKKKDDLSLPVLPAANGNHSARKSQEQDVSKDAEEASTTRDITSDIEDTAILPEDVIVDAQKDSSNDRQDLISDVKIIDEEKRGKDVEEFPRKDEIFTEKRGSLEEFEELEQFEKEKAEEVFKDSLNVTPEVLDVPSRPDSLEPDDQGEKLQDDDLAQDNAFDGLKNKLIEIEMAERSIEQALAGQQITTYDGGKVTSQAEKSMTDGTINEAGETANEVEEVASEIEKSTDEGKILMNKDNEGEKDDDKKRKKSVNEIEKIENIIKISIDKPDNSSNKTERSTDEMEEKVKDKVTESTSKTENLSTTEKSTNKIEQMKNKVETSINKIENLTKIAEESVSEIKKSTNKTSEKEISKNGIKESKHQAEILESKELIEDEKSTNRSEKSTNKKLSNVVEELAVKVQDTQSINSRSLRKDKITETVVCETDDDNNTASKSEAKNAPNELSKASTAGNAAIEGEISMTNLRGESGKTKERRKRETGKLPATSPLSLDIPYSYVLSEGSPCEIPDSVTTVIIPDRPCSSPVIADNSQLASTKESFIRSNITDKISQDEARKKDRGAAYGMEAFGEHIHPEVAVLPVDIDFVRGKRGVRASQDLLIAHQDLDRIKEEGEEEEEREDKGKETEIHREKEDDKQTVVQDKEKLAGTLENIAEHENEETEKVTAGFKDTEEIPSSDVPEQESPFDTMELILDINSGDEGKVDVAVECKSTLENSSEESGSTQDTRTTTSSDVKESTASNRSGVESPSTGAPIVPELNLDSLLDNTVSSFKITANDTVTREDNGSAKESDTTMSLIEPLTSDEMNQLILADAEEDLVAEELTESLLRELQAEEQAAQSLEADQSYREEHAEYEWLEKDPLLETNLKADVKSQDSIGLKGSPEDAQVAQVSEEKEKELDSEEEIAKELISSLDKDMQIRTSKEESKDNGDDVKSNLNVNDKSNQSVHSITIDEPEKKEHEVSSERIETLDNKEGVKTEIVSELSSSIADDRDKDIAITNKEAEESKLEIKEQIETEKAAPLAQFEQELLEQNSRPETADKKLVKNESANAIDNQEKLEDKQANIEVLENESSKSVSKIEELNIKHEENNQEKLQDQKEELNNREEREQKKSEIQEECEQNKLNIQEKNSQENSESQEKIVDVQAEPLETAESRKDSINESTKDNDKHEETKLIKHDEFVTNDQVEKQVENEKEEKIENLPAKIENVPITSTKSIQSSKDHSRGYWTMETKSSTVETVVEVNDSNTSTDEKTEAVADAPKIIEGESLAQKKDDVYSAVLKIQACTRGFLARRRMRKDLNSKPVSNEISSAQKTATDNHLLPQNPSNVREVRTGRQRLRREEALRNTTLSLENAFATGRLQHTGEFHDSVPLPLFDMTNSETNSTPSDDSLSKEVEEDPKQSDVAKSNTNNSGSTHGEHEGIFQKRNAFTDSFPIVMHLLADASRNFGVNHSRPDFNANTAKAKSVKSALDSVLMLGYPRDDDNRYLNFITSVEDLGCNMDSLPFDDAMKSSKNVDNVHLPMTSGEGSLKEPLALPGTPQGVVIEEVTSLESEIPSESTKPSTAPRTSLDTNSSMPLEKRTLEDEKNDLDMSSRTADAIGDRKHADEEQNSDCNLENAGGGNLHENKKSNEISRDNHERTNGKQNEKT